MEKILVSLNLDETGCETLKKKSMSKDVVLQTATLIPIV